MERICETTPDSDYHAIQHFISESPWDYRRLMDHVALNVSKNMSSTGQKVALLLDETGMAKKGKQSVGVARQYSGTLGKVDNCQVAVYCALSSDKYYSLIDTALYLPQEWTSDNERCQRAGIPHSHRKPKTKLELALQLVKHQKAIGTAFDYVGGDGLYGNNYALIEELDKMGITAVFDVHADQNIYITPPVLYVPENKNRYGRKTSRVKNESAAVTVKDFYQSLPEGSFTEVILRPGSKGILKSQAFYQTVYTWDGHSPHYNERTLLIRITRHSDDEIQVKYAITNAKPQDVSLQELTQMQAQRSYIERAFQECKQDIGMSEYQVRGWLAWRSVSWHRPTFWKKSYCTSKIILC